MTKQYKDRLKILEDHEIDELYGLSRFDSDEQSYYFSLTQEERDLANKPCVVHFAGWVLQSQNNVLLVRIQ
jgi:hypothetical protein